MSTEYAYTTIFAPEGSRGCEWSPGDISHMIIYLRKSRSDDPYLSVEDVLSKHETQLQEFAQSALGGKIPGEHIFREVVSGETIADRPVMKRVLELLETGSIKGVLVIEPQRLSRGDLEDCGRIVNVFRYTKTLVITPPKTYNLNDEYDRKFFEMELMRGNDYLEYTKKILNRGRIASVKQGNFIGSVAPYGYKKVTKGTGRDACPTLEIIPEQADAVRLMYQLYIEGNGFTNIAKKLDTLGIKPLKSETWSPAAISDMLKNPVYIGMVRWNYLKTVKKMVNGQIVKSRPMNQDSADWFIVKGKHEPIIDQATFAAAQERRGKTPKVKGFRELKNPFAGLAVCSTCGSAMSLKIYTQRRSGTITELMLCNKQSRCKTRSVKYDVFVERVMETLEKNIADFEIKLQNEAGNTSDLRKNVITNLEKELERLKDKDIRQKDAYEEGIYTKEEYAARNARLQEQIAKTQNALFQANASMKPAIDYQEKILRFTDCLKALKNPDIPALDKNLLLKSCISKIVYSNHTESKPGIGRWTDNIFRLDITLKL